MKQSNLRFSIIVCAYNVEEYIGRGIESILRQDFKNYELLIVNDGSTDNTAKVVNSYKNERIKFINCRKNRGPSCARNTAVSKAKGEYILYLDADDTLYEDTTLSKVNETIGNEKIDLIYFGVQYIGGNNNKAYIPNEENSSREARIACDMHFPVASKCWRREFLKEKNINFVGGLYYEDMVYSIKAAIFADKLKYGSFPIYNYYRNREGSIMSTPSMKRCTDMYIVLAHLMALYEITPKEYKPYLLSFIKNETNSIPMRIDAIIDSLENGTNSPVLPKRNYRMIEKTEVKK